ncbi:potassium channel subfamily K member 18 [Sardina pilchardus]|uniref:potassium channel subfamily K member 18 n=1 Tax=Sardina pilchardus TaxID=27697 RepID=UPI002E16247D
MSVATKGNPSERSRCYTFFWRLFPHVFLILSLIAYGVLGALVFWKIEGGRELTDQQAYRGFVSKLIDQANASDVDRMLRTELKAIWLQHPDKWSFYGSLFFCCTVFTTVGYGEIYPVTMAGKLICILYAMVGIPLMLLVITDVGDVLARFFSRGYHHLHKLARLLRRRRQRRKRALADGTYTFSHEVVVREPLDLKQVLRAQASVKRKSVQLFNNQKIFERLIAREKLGRAGPLLRSRSCPELNRAPTTSYHLWDLDGIGTDMDQLNVPMLLILLVVFAYILFGGLVLPLWETEFKIFDAFYFCFITLTTIGFGDIVPSHPKFFMLTFVFIISGMAIMSMAFKLGQSTIISCYRRCMRCISRGRVKYEFIHDD